ncbi:flagellar hook-associated protein FlgK [Eilatimonas milleporae]|uniref:Flagellar hook-associated protein 1 n=1 Tax=Eilatimonas milleporae TaxID=911205 RepID=A0A3M0C4Y3_9PROT|nr:flagellar hook-associated protein FlgK [Eilatimonas milleporae]RMB04884.1 flagellar hook-associated protein 1 FlgK [Eilatimonas milleporae]
MALNNIIDTSLSGLFLNQSALRVTSSNIANVNTPGYSRLQVSQEARVLSGQAAGVQLSGIDRVVDRFLDSALRTSISNVEEYSVQSRFHDALQGFLGRPDSDSSLSSQFDQVFGSIAALSLSPSESLRRQEVLNETQDFLNQMNRIQGQIQDLRADTGRQIDETLRGLNENLARVFELNNLILSQSARGGEIGGLEGQLDDALRNISEVIDINITRESNNTARVTTASGLPLVDFSLRQLTFDAPGVVGAETQFPPIEIAVVDPVTLQPITAPTDMAPHIRSGSLRGLLDIRDNQLVDLSQTLGELGARVADEFNAVHNGFSATPAPGTLTGKQTFVTGTQPTNFTGTVEFAVVDADNQLVAKSTIDLTAFANMNAVIAQVNTDLGGAGTLGLTDGVLSLDAATAGNGVVIADVAGQETDRGGRSFSHFFGMNDLIQTDNAGIYETGFAATDSLELGGAGTIDFRVRDANGVELTTVTVDISALPINTVNDLIGTSGLSSPSGLGAFFSFGYDANGQITAEPLSTRPGVTLEVISDSTDIGGTGINLNLAFGLDPSQRGNAARNLTVREDVLSNPNLLSMSVFDNTAAVGATAMTSGDQRGARALQELQTSTVNFGSAGELASTSLSLTQYLGRFLDNAGLQARRAASLEEDNRALNLELEQRRADVSGVNLDEELSNLVVFQNAYNAAARILSTVQELYDELLATV